MITLSTDNPEIIPCQTDPCLIVSITVGLPYLIEEVFVLMLSLKRVLSRYQRTVAILLALGILFGLFVLGAQPFAVGLVPAPWDKVAHAVVFAVMAVAIGLASGVQGWRMVLLVVAGALLVGALDEWHQVFLSGRQAGWDDLAADGLGGLIGALMMSYRWPEANKE
jgi:hypothetical protein